MLLFLLDFAYSTDIYRAWYGAVSEIFEVNKYRSCSIQELMNIVGGEGNYVTENFVSAAPGKNVVIIYCESLENGYFDCGLLDKVQSLIGNKFICYGNYGDKFGAGWTIGALYATQTSFPCLFSHTGEDVFKHIRSSKVLSYAKVMEKAGYNNLFLTSGDLNFAGTESMMKILGYDVRKHEDFKIDFSRTKWGIHDYDLFQQAKIEYKRMIERGKPFNLTLLTMDTHCPKGMPDKRMEQYINDSDSDSDSLNFCLKSLDFLLFDFCKFVWSIGGDNTEIIIIGDHPIMGDETMTPIIGKLRNKPKKMVLCSTTKSKVYFENTELAYYDIPSFVLDVAGIKHNAKFLKAVIPNITEDKIREKGTIFVNINMKLCK